MTAIVGIVELRDERDEPYLVTPNMFACSGAWFHGDNSSLQPCRAKHFSGRSNCREAIVAVAGGEKETRLKAAVEAKDPWTRVNPDMDLKSIGYSIRGTSLTCPNGRRRPRCGPDAPSFWGRLPDQRRQPAVGTSVRGVAK